MRIKIIPLVRYPLLTLRFPADREADLIGALIDRANDCWEYVPDKNNANNASLRDTDRCLRFDRLATSVNDSACIVLVYSVRPRELQVYMQRVGETELLKPLDVWNRVLTDFAEQIARPAAASVGGRTCFR
jgi:hypothetical protein